VDPRTLLDDEERAWLELTEVFGELPPERFEDPSLNA
jgi:hypothetical protein